LLETSLFSRFLQIDPLSHSYIRELVSKPRATRISIANAALSPASLRKKRNRQQLPPGEAKKFRSRSYHGPSRFLCVCVCVYVLCVDMCARASLSLPLSSRNWMSHASDKKLAAPVRKTGFFFLHLETAAEALVFVYFGRFTRCPTRRIAAKSARPSSICRFCFENSFRPREASYHRYLSLHNFLDFRFPAPRQVTVSLDKLSNKIALACRVTLLKAMQCNFTLEAMISILQHTV